MPSRRMISTRTASTANGAPEGRGYVYRGNGGPAPAEPASRHDAEKQALGAAIRAARGTRRQSEVAAVAGISGAHLSNIERGHDRPSPDVLSRLAAAYGVKPSELLMPGTGDPVGAVEPAVDASPGRPAGNSPGPRTLQATRAAQGPNLTNTKGRPCS